MIDRKTIYYYIGLATLCVTVVVVLVFYVKPLVAGKSIKISKAPSGQKGGVFKALDYTASTLAIMQSKNEDKEIILSMNTDRNPFLWYDEIGPKKENFEHRKKKIRQGPLPKLGMIIVSPKRRIVYLDHKPVYEGQQHGGYLVEKIVMNKVTLSNAYGRLQLIAPKNSFGPAKVKRLERSKY